MKLITASEENFQPASLYILTDSRKVTFPDQSIFFAIKGERHDGHQYISTLYQAGVREFVIEFNAMNPTLSSELLSFEEGTAWIVDSSVRALQALAQQKRKAVAIPTVAITGSNGKTIVKEWLTQLVSPSVSVLASPKSYNSQIGVPLSIWPISTQHQLAILEAGISQPHEMEYLEKIICPTHGIFTNIGTAHDEGFKSQKQKVAEKLKLFSHVNKLIYRADYAIIQEEIDLLLQPVNPTIALLSWATHATASIQVTWQTTPTNTAITLTSTHYQHTFTTHFKDQASLENLTHCLVYLLDFGLDASTIQERIGQLHSVAMRLEMKQGIYRSEIIDDTYNNDLQGLRMALDFIREHPQKKKQVVILSDILQTGLDATDLYQQVSNLLSTNNTDLFIGIGPVISENASQFDAIPSLFYTDTQAFLTSFDYSKLADSLVLVKGARTFAFERIIYRLQEKVHSTILEIDLNALTHNLNFYRSQIGPATKMMVMVKAYAYGSGSTEVAALLQHHRIDYLAVAYPDEGVALRHNGITLPIMVMNAEPDSYDVMIRFQLEPEIYSFRTLQNWIEATSHYSHTDTAIPPIHLKIDTGMHRLGFIDSDLSLLKKTIVEHPVIRIASIFTHLAGADELIYDAFTKQQYALLKHATEEIKDVLAYEPICHILNSAGIINYPEYKWDMVRLGIGLYGVDASNKFQSQLKVVGTLRTVISQIKTYNEGETVGYSRRGVLQQTSRIATIAMGYADGLDRRCGNGNCQVMINGVLCPTVGNICMDMAMVDITNVSAQEGNEVIIFGENPHISTIATQIGTIPYEIITGISDRVKRIFVKE